MSPIVLNTEATIGAVANDFFNLLKRNIGFRDCRCPGCELLLIDVLEINVSLIDVREIEIGGM